MSSRVDSIFVIGFPGSSPALIKAVDFENPGFGGERALMVVFLPSRIIANSCASRYNGLGKGCALAFLGFDIEDMMNLLQSTGLGSWVWEDHRRWL